MKTFKAAVRLRSRNQFTIPTKVVSALSLQEGDFLEVTLDEGGVIGLRPATLVRTGSPEAELADANAEEEIATGKVRSFATASDAMSFLRRRSAEPTGIEEDEGGVIGLRPATLVRTGSPEAELADANAEEEIATGKVRSFATASDAMSFLRRLRAEDEPRALVRMILNWTGSTKRAREILDRAQRSLTEEIG